jgi:murein DD-endopeptidase MepM/ murein hydrolase activator NlpD
VRAFHEGVDYGAPSGTPVYAAQGGSIVALDRTAHSGLYMRLRHSSGVETFYGHLSRTMPGLKAGGVIRAGDVIGFVGESGFATGPHLHYEVLVNGRPIDPDSSRYLARMVSLR